MSSRQFKKTFVVSEPRCPATHAPEGGSEQPRLLAFGPMAMNRKPNQPKALRRTQRIVNIERVLGGQAWRRNRASEERLERLEGAEELERDRVLSLVRTRHLALRDLPKGFLESEVLRHRAEVEAVFIVAKLDAIERVEVQLAGKPALPEAEAESLRAFLAGHLNRKLDIGRVFMAYGQEEADQRVQRPSRRLLSDTGLQGKVHVVHERRLQQRRGLGDSKSPSLPPVPLLSIEEEVELLAADYQLKRDALIKALNMGLAPWVGWSSGSFDDSRRVVEALSRLARRLSLRFECQKPGCGSPSTLVLLPGKTRTGAFAFRHNRTNHGGTTTLPLLRLIPANDAGE